MGWMELGWSLLPKQHFEDILWIGGNHGAWKILVVVNASTNFGHCTYFELLTHGKPLDAVARREACRQGMNIVQLPSQRHRHPNGIARYCQVAVWRFLPYQGQRASWWHLSCPVLQRLCHYVYGYGIWMVAQATTLFDVAVQFCGRRQTLSFVIRL